MNYVSAGNKKYRLGKKNCIKYYSKMPDNAVCILYTKLEKLDDETANDEECLSIDGTKYALCDMPDKFKTLGYIKTDEPDLYVSIVEEKSTSPSGVIGFLHGSSGLAAFLIVLLISGVAIIGGVIIDNMNKTGKLSIGVPSTEKVPTGTEDISSYDSEEEETVAINQKYTVIDAITYEGDYMDISGSDTVPFGNSPDNEGIYLQYVVKDLSANEIYVSPKLNPGEKISWQPAKYLNGGIQSVVISVNVYHQDTNVQDIGTDMEVKFNIHK